MPDHRAKLLVVDDDPVVRQSLVDLLSLRFEVVEAVDGEAGLAKARSEHPNLVLADVHLPKVDGLGFLRALREDAALSETPVVFLSAPSDELPVRCLELGAADFVAKPANGRELVARVEKALKASREREALRELAQTDALTGLANFRALRSRFDQEHARALRYRYPLSLVMIDLDRLKLINDRFGHDVGNRAIVSLATQLRLNLRETDFAARYGGDEFFVLLPYQTPAEAAIFCERLRSTLAAEALVSSDGPTPQLALTISCGIAGHFEASPMEDADTLLRAADAALYEAKRRGRNRVVVSDQATEAAVVDAEQLG